MEEFGGNALGSGCDDWADVVFHDKEENMKSLGNKYEAILSALKVKNLKSSSVAPDILCPQKNYS